MKIDHIFPIPIVTTTVDPELVANSLGLVYDYIDETKCLEEPRDSNQLLTTYYQKDKNFLGRINDLPMIEVINSEARKFLELLGFDRECYLDITSWLQLYPPGADFNRHDHYGALISGCYYLQVPENSGDIVFFNPIETRRVTDVFFNTLKKEDNGYNFYSVNHTPVKGELILFESWLHHSVTVNKSDKNRIAISFNIWAGPNGTS